MIKSKRKIIINDPIYKVMDFGSSEKDRSAMKNVMDTQSFQRLRHINQLGAASLFFQATIQDFIV
jgi:HD superfamily phosphohydrolase